MRVLSVASEVAPLIKTGGLADVAGALPAALAEHGVEVTTALPGYRPVLAALKVERTVGVKALGHKVQVRVGQAMGLSVAVIDVPELFARDGGPYSGPDGADWPDNWERFAVFARAAAAFAAKEGGFDLIHAHDWQAGLVPVYLRHHGPDIPSVMTIHNIAFQGQYGADVFPRLDLPQAAFSMDGVEYYGGVGYLKGGLQTAHAITTVSPTYAQEIRRAEFGMGLEGLINARHMHLHGIVNGIDISAWNPASDPNLAHVYGPRRLPKRSFNKASLEQRFGLEPSDDPLICVISRLSWQKGMDVLATELVGLTDMGARFAILGSGDTGLEAALHAAAAERPGRIGLVTQYDEPLSHLMQGGADAILIPSRFEPCGLTQLYGLRYGCVPIVARTGGLADTIIDANMAAVRAGVATGIMLSDVSRDGLRDGIARTVALWRDQSLWQNLQKAGMRTDVSWSGSAARYAALYQALV